MSFWQWSKTASANGSADPTINFTEGQSPSSVNDSCRALMAASAQYRDDISGRLTTTGTSTAYAVATNSGYPSVPTDGTMIAIVPHIVNGSSPTLAVDGGTAFFIRVNVTDAVPAAALVVGSPYVVVYNSTIPAWILHGYYGNPSSIPIGGVMTYLGTTAPNTNFALAYGQAISRATYAALFAIIGTTYGPGDGVSTFNLPDLRDRTIFGLGNMGGVTAGRISAAGGNYDSTVNGATGGLQNHILLTTEMPSHTHAGTTDSSTHTHSGTTDSGGVQHTHTGTTGIDSRDHNHDYLGPPSGRNGTLSGTGANAWYGADVIQQTSGIGVQAHTHDFTSNGASAFNHTHTFSIGASGSHTHTFTSGASGSGAAHTILPPAISLPMIVRIF